MNHIVSITSQGQLTIPKQLREAFGVRGQTKALIRKHGDTLIVTPKRDFKSLAGSLQGSVRLSDRQLRDARNAFAKKWSRNS